MPTSMDPTTGSFLTVTVHDFTTTVNDFLYNFAAIYGVNYFNLASWLMTGDDTMMSASLKQAGVTVGINELRRILERMGWNTDVVRNWFA